MHRLLGIVILLLAAVIACGGLVWPAAFALQSALSESGAIVSTELTPRRLTLLGRGILVALSAGLLAQAIGGCLSMGLCERRGWLRGLTAWACATAWLAPPYVAAYAWSLPVLPAGIPTGAALADSAVGPMATVGRAIVCLACWVAPAAAVVLALGWRGAGRSARDHALQDATAGRAWVAAALPAMRPWIGLSLAVTFLLALTEFSICHLCLVQTLNTEILAALQEVATPGRALRMAWPLIATAAIPAAILVAYRRHWMHALAQREEFAGEVEDAGLRGVRIAAESGLHPVAGSGSWRVGLPLLSIAILFLPIALLLLHWKSAAAIIHVWSVFPRAWPDGLRIGLLTGGAGGLLAAGIYLLRAMATGRRAGPIRSILTFLWASTCLLAAAGAGAPPGVIGDAVLGAYLGLPGIGQTHWAMVATGVARFSIFAIVLVLWSVMRREAELSAMDGAGPLHAAVRVQLPRLIRPLVLGAGVVGLMSMFDVGAAQLVSPPGVQSVAITLLNQIHFGRNDDVIALSLSAYLVSACAVWLLFRLKRRHPGVESRAARQRGGAA